MKRILIASVAVALGAVGLMATGQANAAAVAIPRGGEQATYGFWPASQPNNSGKVGIFVARRDPSKGGPELYYCSAPADASAKDPAVCKKIENLPGE